MDVRLTVAWVDPAGVKHLAGDVVEVDPVTLAELEEQHMVDEPQELVEEPTTTKPAETEQDFLGPGKVEKGEVTVQGGFLGPGKVEKVD